jgi:diguanylate cyclase (GGDEF)-like protein
LSCLSLAAPLGFVVLECALVGRLPSARWIAADVARRPEIYAYLLLSSLAVLALLGFLLGKKQDLLEAAWVDELTGLASRRLFVTRLEEEIRRSDRLRMPLTLLLIDVDNLKAINDGGGHEAGDAALRAVGESLRATCRHTDLPARFGGDEFAVIAPFVEANQGMELAERIRKSLSARRGGPASITVSIGVADLANALERTLEAICDAADRALYEAKSRGRNCAAMLPRASTDLERDVANDSVREASGV